MITVQLKPLYHRGIESIAICFEPAPAVQQAIRKLQNIRWSKTHKCWWLPLSRQHYESIVQACKGKAVVENELLKKYLLHRKQQGKAADLQPLSPGVSPPLKRAVAKKGTGVKTELGPANQSVGEQLRQHLVLKGYSAATIKTYLNEMHVFLCTIGQHAAADFTAQRLKDYRQ